MMLVRSPRSFAAGLVAAALLATAAPAHEDLDLGQARADEVLELARARQLEALWDEIEGFDDLELGDALKTLGGTEAVLALAELGEPSPLRAELDPATWGYLRSSRPLLRGVVAWMRGSLKTRSREALLERGELGVQKALVGSVNLALRFLPEAEGAGGQGRLLFAAQAWLELATAPELLQALLAMSASPELPPELQQACGNLYVLHGRTASRLEVARRRYLASLGAGA